MTRRLVRERAAACAREVLDPVAEQSVDVADVEAVVVVEGGVDDPATELVGGEEMREDGDDEQGQDGVKADDACRLAHLERVYSTAGGRVNRIARRGVLRVPAGKPL